MRFISRQFKQILITAAFVLFAVTAMSQQAKHKSYQVARPIIAKPISYNLAHFYHLTNEAGIVFTFPAGFRELPVSVNKDFPYDFAMELPGQDFEIWFQVKSQKENLADYEKYKNDPAKKVANPDSLYNQIGLEKVNLFTGDQNYFTTIIPQDILKRYNATSGKTYLLNLLDLPETKHYKYAMLITLQKGHVGTIIAVCFANEKGADFFKNMNKASKCLKFKS
jgi:hypothetical protein